MRDLIIPLRTLQGRSNDIKPLVVVMIPVVERILKNGANHAAEPQSWVTGTTELPKPATTTTRANMFYATNLISFTLRTWS